MTKILKLIAHMLLMAALALAIASCDDDTSEPVPVEAAGVTLSVQSLTLVVGESETLTATVKPDNAANKTLTWTGSAPDIATVVDGLVTAVAVGSATVTVATANGKSATCTVTVVAAEVPVTGITLEPATLEMLVEATYSLTATVLPDDATHQTLTWTSSAPDIATVADGLVTAVAVGSTTITVATANGKTADCEVTVDYIVETVLIPAGTFLMGSSDGSNTGSGMPNVDVNATPDEPNRIPYFEQQHRVTLTKDYYMSRYEITNAQYAAFLNDAGVGSNGKKPDIQDGQTLISISGSYNWCLRWSGNRWESIVGYANHPAIFVSWYGAKAYAEWAGGNLPTEAQWERAARGSAENMPFGIGSDRALTADIANFNGYYPYSFDSGGESFDGFTGSHLNRTSAVGSYSPNAYVLYDMHGNAREWCLDKWDGSDNYAGLPDTDPLCTEGSSCVLRGGGWDSYSNPCRSAYRQRAIPGTCINNAGFRIVFIAD